MDRISCFFLPQHSPHKWQTLIKRNVKYYIVIIRIYVIQSCMEPHIVGVDGGTTTGVAGTEDGEKKRIRLESCSCSSLS